MMITLWRRIYQPILFGKLVWPKEWRKIDVTLKKAARGGLGTKLFYHIINTGRKSPLTSTQSPRQNSAELTSQRTLASCSGLGKLPENERVPCLSAVVCLLLFV